MLKNLSLISISFLISVKNCFLMSVLTDIKRGINDEPEEFQDVLKLKYKLLTKSLSYVLVFRRFSSVRRDVFLNGVSH